INQSGSAELYRNVSTTAPNGGAFLPPVTFGLAGGTSANSYLALGDMNGDGKPDLAATNGAPMGTGNQGKLTVMQNATIGGSVVAATNSTPIVITSQHNGLLTGQSVAISGAQGNTAANGTWTITRLSGAIATANGSGSTNIIINSVGHGLANGESVTISGSP